MPPVFDSRQAATPYRVSAGETLGKIVASRCPQGVTWRDVARFNWGTDDPIEVNRALIEMVGCARLQEDPSQTVLDPSRGTNPQILVPRIFQRDGLSTEQTHTIVVRRLLPAPAISITRLDKWFIPGDETCDIHYYVEGVRERADKVDFEVYASHYAKATAQAVGDFLKFSFTELDIPIRRHRYLLKQTRTAYQIPEWRGESEAADGVLKPRPNQTRYINVAFSPYTIQLRYFKAAADANARIRLDPFWVEFEKLAGGAPRPRDDSLRIRWRVSGTGKLRHGQIIIWDKDGVPIFRKALAAGDLAEGNHEYFWQEGYNLARPEGMPYRVQIQAHTDMFTDDGLALAVAHTEVRLWCHAESGRDPATIWKDPVSLEMGLAPFCPPPPPPPNSVRFFKQKLAAAGYHPGPIDEDQNREDFKVALKEFQRSWPVPRSDGTWGRLEAKGNLDDATKKQLRNLPPEHRAMFGDPASQADLAVADAAARLADPSQGLIVWVDDRHCYTEGLGDPKGPMAMNNYRGPMDIGDKKVAKDRESIARPWIPLQVSLPLLSKSDPLEPRGRPPRVTENMRRAVGPLRVDWIFKDLEPDPSFVPSPPDPTMHRARAWIWKIVGQRNCPQTWKGTDCGGIRPESGDGYYKAAFGFGAKNSLQPWLAYDDSGGKTVCTLVHDDLGQASQKLFPTHVGRAGIYLRPSRIAGDGYMFSARVSFEPIPGGADFPNRTVLKKRYPLCPVGRTCGMRVWRRTCFRGYIGWLPQAQTGWQEAARKAAAYYRPAYVHFEAIPAREAGFPVTALITESEFVRIVNEGMKEGDTPFWRARLTPRYTPGYIWPYLHVAHYGLWPTPEPLERFEDWLRSGLDEISWDHYCGPLMMLLIRRVEERYGRLRGHLLVEFATSPPLLLLEYSCEVCCRTYSMVANDPTSSVVDPSSNIRVTPPVMCLTPGCKGTVLEKSFRETGRKTLEHGFPLPALGLALGGCWLYLPRRPDTWAHEMGHHRHLEHAQGSSGDKPPAGAKLRQHDSRSNPHRKSEKYDHQRGWDRFCIMSYARGSWPAFCGKCLLRNRGWAVESIDDPAEDVNDTNTKFS